jgi:choline transport protein
MDLRTIEVCDAKGKEGSCQEHGSGEPTMEKSERGTVGDVEELPRKFSVWSLGSLLICLMATWEALSSVVAQALISGGAPCLFYN